MQNASLVKVEDNLSSSRYQSFARIPANPSARSVCRRKLLRSATQSSSAKVPHTACADYYDYRPSTAFAALWMRWNSSSNFAAIARL